MFNTSKVQICQLHKSQICIGFCVSTKCPQTSIYCQRCLEEDHSDHIESCKQFGQITKDLSISIKEKKDHLDKIREKQIQLSQLNRHQIDAYEKQIKDLRNIQGQFQQKKLNSLSNQQILILKEEHQPDRQLDDLDKLNQIEQLIQSLELIKRICLTNEKQKFTKYMMNFLTKGSSWCIAIFHVIVCIMYIYLFLIGAVVMLLIYVEIDEQFNQLIKLQVSQPKPKLSILRNHSEINSIFNLSQ
ncbi:unnamed protein product [Paramecium octaurelia]|uniref:Uncharacterized protein n=1 Tax=Paramecium octaurelia TaxID=43137 RepID=A0A8S1XQ12_PAROT|nr:unnamed protein product [Paramecium octaurelia]